jgi:hypothetical protein
VCRAQRPYLRDIVLVACAVSDASFYAPSSLGCSVGSPSPRKGWPDTVLARLLESTGATIASTARRMRRRGAKPRTPESECHHSPKGGEDERNDGRRPQREECHCERDGERDAANCPHGRCHEAGKEAGPLAKNTRARRDELVALVPLRGQVTKRCAQIGSGACMESEVDPRPQLLKRYSAFDEVILQRSCRKLTFTVTDQSHDENDRSSRVAGASSYVPLSLGCSGGLEPGPPRP